MAGHFVAYLMVPYSPIGFTLRDGVLFLIRDSWLVAWNVPCIHPQANNGSHLRTGSVLSHVGNFMYQSCTCTREDSAMVSDVTFSSWNRLACSLKLLK